MRTSPTLPTADLGDLLHKIPGPNPARYQVIGDRHMNPGPLPGHKEHLDRVLVLIPKRIHEQANLTPVVDGTVSHKQPGPTNQGFTSSLLPPPSSLPQQPFDLLLVLPLFFEQGLDLSSDVLRRGS